MTPLEFEARYEQEWDELESLLSQLRVRFGRRKEPVRAERLAGLYRRICEQLALARARAYPPHIVERLNQLTTEAHQAIYQQRNFGLSQLRRLVTIDFPLAVRAQARYVWLSAALFAVPLFVLGALVYFKPGLILALVDPVTAASYEYMYSQAESIGRMRNVSSDWQMFGFYIRNNIGIGFQCFAGGIFAGIGSLFFLAYNGAAIGAVAGFLTSRGLAESFYSFVATHSSFELIAIVLSGAAGLRIGHALIAPGRRRRRDALVIATREAIVLVYGATALFFIAAAVEAFWSSARWIPLPLKYGVAAGCWFILIAYMWRQGRPTKAGAQRDGLQDGYASHAR